MFSGTLRYAGAMDFDNVQKSKDMSVNVMLPVPEELSKAVY